MSSSAGDSGGRSRDRRRILILPTEIAGYAARLQSGFREIGWQADVLDLSGDPFGYGSDPPPDRCLRLLAGCGSWGARHGPVAELAVGALSVPLRFWGCVSLVRHYDAAVYLFGKSLLWGLDLRLARRRGIRTVAVFLGSDSRPPYLSGNYLNTDGPVRWRLVRFRSRRVSRRVRSIEKHSGYVVCNPASAQFLTGRFVNWFDIGMPVDEAPLSTRDHRAPGAVVKALHAPSSPIQKGTPRIGAAVGRAGNRLSLTYLSGVSNARVRQLMAGSDLVIDEMYSDTPLGGLGSEAAAAGVPALSFGFAADFLRPYLARSGVPIEQYAAPEDLDRVVARAARDPEWLRDLGRSVRDFVRSSWRPSDVARRIEVLLTGSPPEEWWADPAEVDYFWGYGMDRETALSGWSRYLRRFGRKALFLPAGSRAEDRLLAAVTVFDADGKPARDT